MRTLLVALTACLYVTGCGGDSGSSTTTTTTTTTPATLVSIAASAANPAIPKAFSEQLAATGTYSDGTSADITSSVTWSSADTTVAEVNAAGVVSGITAGTSAISATLGGISGSTTVVVTAATLSSITVTPATMTLPDGLTQQLTAVGSYSDGTSLNITSSVTWISANISVATVASSGIARAAAAGTATITATFGSVSGSAAFTATAATLESLAITPTNPNFPDGLTQKLTATSTYSDGSSRDISALAVWSSSDGSVASVDATGVARGLDAGTSTITATSGAVSTSTTLSVTAATLTSIAIGPANPSVLPGLTQQLTATGTYSDGASFDLTSAVTWSSSAVAVATVSAGGLSNGVTVGSATITATFGAVSGTATLRVTPAVLLSIALTPATPTVANGLSQQFTATGAFSDGSSRDVTSSVTWSSANPSVATVGATGLAQSLSVGTSTISATSGTVSASTLLTVTAASLTSIAITPTNPSIYHGITQQFTATGTYSDGTQSDLTATVSWSSSATFIATISASGLATPVGSAGLGTTVIGATLGAVSASTNLMIAAPPMVTATAVVTLPANGSGTESIIVAVNGTQYTVLNITPGSSACSAGNTCTITFSAPVGADTVSFTTYDQTNTASGPFSGNILAEATVPYTVSLSGANQMNLTMIGIPVSITVAPTSNSPFLIGSIANGFVLYGSAVQSINVVPYDADHNAILGAGAPSLGVEVTGTSSVAVTQGNSPNVFGLRSVAPGTSGTLVVTATAATGGPPTGPNPMLSTSLATQPRIVYVAESATGSVDAYYNGQATPTSSISAPAVGGLALSSDGSIIIPFPNNNSVTVYVPNAAASYSITAGLNFPANACSDHEKNIYVVNSNGNANDDGDTAVFPEGQLAKIADYTIDENSPVACAIDTDDSLWVINGADSTIVHYPHNSPTPDQYWLLASSSTEVPNGLAIDHTGDLYVSSVDLSGVARVRFYPKGSQTSSFAIITGQGAVAGGSLAVDASGALWVGNYDGSLVYYSAPVTASSVPVNYNYVGATNITGIAVSP